MYRVSFVFTKKGLMKFISHLDLLRLFMRAFRRADLPLKMTQGFNPHPRFKINRALKLGLESEHEEAELVINEYIREKDFISLMEKQLPAGIDVRQARVVFSP